MWAILRRLFRMAFVNLAILIRVICETSRNIRCLILIKMCLSENQVFYNG